jgi:hypothetical protein
MLSHFVDEIGCAKPSVARQFVANNACDFRLGNEQGQNRSWSVVLKIAFDRNTNNVFKRIRLFCGLERPIAKALIFPLQQRLQQHNAVGEVVVD